MPKMPEGAWRDFLTSQPRTGKLATTRKSGAPHVTPVWFDLDGNEIVFTTHDTSIKARNIARDARVCLCVDDDTPPSARGRPARAQALRRCALRPYTGPLYRYSCEARGSKPSRR